MRPSSASISRSSSASKSSGRSSGGMTLVGRQRLLGQPPSLLVEQIGRAADSVGVVGQAARIDGSG